MKRGTVRLGVAGYARLMALLHDEPMTAAGLQTAGRIGRTAANNFLGSMHRLGLVHISGWSMAYRTPARPLYFAMPGADAPRPKARPNGLALSGAAVVARLSVASPEVIGFKVLLDAIQEPRTRKEIVAHTGLDPRTVRRGLAALVKYRLAHIVCWTARDCGFGMPEANYQLGRGQNAPRPAPPSTSDELRRYRERRAVREAMAPLVAAFSRPQPMLEPA